MNKLKNAKPRVNKMGNFRTSYKILLAIFTVCLIVSLILTFIPVDKICGEKTSSCSVVQHSKYEKVLGVSNSYFGIIAFTLLIFILIFQIINPSKNKARIIALGITMSSIAATYFILLQLFVIKAICPYCMIIDILTLIAMGIIIKRKKMWK